MRSDLWSQSRFVLIKSPSYRHQAARRRVAVICAILGLALASGLIGTLASPKGQNLATTGTTGPFSYFPYS